MASLSIKKKAAGGIMANSLVVVPHIRKTQPNIGYPQNGRRTENGDQLAGQRHFKSNHQ
jgi:hypothetical protein